ncbi:hypothetical protein V8B97DRAFT_1920237 [Scleroderma yunnanense]
MVVRVVVVVVVSAMLVVALLTSVMALELVVASSLPLLIGGVVNGVDGHEVVVAHNGGLGVGMDLESDWSENGLADYTRKSSVCVSAQLDPAAMDARYGWSDKVKYHLHLRDVPAYTYLLECGKPMSLDQVVEHAISLLIKWMLFQEPVPMTLL